MLAKKTSGIRNVNLPLLMFALPENHVNQAIIQTLERLESAVYDKKKSFRGKVEVLMSVLESLLVDCLTRVSPEVYSMLFDFLLKHTLILVLHGDFMNDKGITLHMLSLFKQLKFRAEKKKLVHVVSEIEHLLELMENDPWGSTVMSILVGRGLSDEELLDFVRKELGTFLGVRIEVLLYAKCETEALVIVEKCLECTLASCNIECFKSFTQEVTHLKDLYILILLKTMNTECIKREVYKMGFKECVRFVKRCQNGALPFQSNLNNSVKCVVSVALAVIKYIDSDNRYIRELITLWFNNLTDDNLSGMLNNLVSTVTCPMYIYLLGEELMKRLPLNKEQCVKVFVRGLTLNVNEIEVSETNNDQTKVKELKVQFANAILQLGEYLKSNFLLHREFVLTAFSLAPSQSGLEMIKAFGHNSGKVNDRENQNAYLVNNYELLLSDNIELNLSITAQSVRNSENLMLKNKSFCEKTILKNLDSVHIHQPETYEIHQVLNPDGIKEDGGNSNNTCALSSHESKHNEDIRHIEDHNQQTTSFPEPKTVECFRVYDAKGLGISQTLCDDLATVANCIKNQTLSWELGWGELYQRCEKYLIQYESAGSPYKYSNVVEDAELCSGANNCNRPYLAKTPSKSLKRKRRH